MSRRADYPLTQDLDPQPNYVNLFCVGRPLAKVFEAIDVGSSVRAPTGTLA